jgi:hypothetical protein
MLENRMCRLATVFGPIRFFRRVWQISHWTKRFAEPAGGHPRGPILVSGTNSPSASGRSGCLEQSARAPFRRNGPECSLPADQSIFSFA